MPQVAFWLVWWSGLACQEATLLPSILTFGRKASGSEHLRTQAEGSLEKTHSEVLVLKCSGSSLPSWLCLLLSLPCSFPWRFLHSVWKMSNSSLFGARLRALALWLRLPSLLRSCSNATLLRMLLFTSHPDPFCTLCYYCPSILLYFFLDFWLFWYGFNVPLPLIPASICSMKNVHLLFCFSPLADLVPP